MLNQRSRLMIVPFLIYAQLSNASAKNDLRVHEWGTFTSVQGSNGEVLFGLEHEEESLPSFVHNRDPQVEALRYAFSEDPDPSSSPSPQPVPRHCSGCKGMCCNDLVSAFTANPALASIGGNERLRVTQKMETPVLYFYSAKPTKVDVTVDFPKGIISQYYPRPTSFLPNLGGSVPLAGGEISYRGLEILADRSVTNPAIPPVLNGNVYGPARGTHSNLVRQGDEVEKFVFYRGLGDFRTSLRVTSDEKNLVVRDTQGHGIPYLLAVNVQDGKGAFRELGSLSGNGSRSFSMADFKQSLIPVQDFATFEKGVGVVLEKALVASGLYADEAHAMVNTWKVSYFHTNGLRLLYVLPRAETDALLPIQISPKPQELVRTLVGRVEVMTHSEEETLASFAKAVATVPNSEIDSTNPVFAKLGRFAEPKLLRVQQILSETRKGQ